jgi:hypothetical protein
LFIPGRPAGWMNRGTEGEDEPSTKGAAPLLRDLHLCCCRGVVSTEHLVGLYTGREKGLTSSCLGSSSSLPSQWLPRATAYGPPVHIIVTTTLEEVPSGTVGGSCWQGIPGAPVLSSQRIGSNRHPKHFGKLTTVVYRPCL